MTESLWAALCVGLFFFLLSKHVKASERRRREQESLARRRTSGVRHEPEDLREEDYYDRR